MRSLPISNLTLFLVYQQKVTIFIISTLVSLDLTYGEMNLRYIYIFQFIDVNNLLYNLVKPKIV